TTGALGDTAQDTAKLGALRALLPAAAEVGAAPVGAVMGYKQAEAEGGDARDKLLAALTGGVNLASQAGGVGGVGTGGGAGGVAAAGRGLRAGAGAARAVPGAVANIGRGLDEYGRALAGQDGALIPADLGIARLPGYREQGQLKEAPSVGGPSGRLTETMTH